MKKSPKKTTKMRMTLDDFAVIVAGEFSRIHEKFKEVKDEMQVGFQKVDDRFKEIDERFNGVDGLFARMDDRFDDIDKRFDVSEAGTHRRLTIVETTLKTLAKK